MWDKTNNAQTIKGNQAGTLHVWFPCSISVRGGGFSGEDQMPEPEVRAARGGGRGGLLPEEGT